MRRFVSTSSGHAAGTIILTALLFIATFSSPIPVSASGNSAPAGKWTVSISGLDGMVCVGDSYMLTATWGLDPNSNDPLSPLTGPKQLLVKATHGSFDRGTERPGTASGTTLFNYTAEKTGTETITIQAFDSDLNVDSQSTTSFEVKKCDYLYTLTSRADAGDAGGVIAFYYIIKSKGLLKAPDPNQPHRLEAFNKTFTIDTTISYFETGDCTLLFSDVGRAMGFVDAKAEDANNGTGIKVMLGPPQDLNYIHDVLLTCPDGPHHQNMTIPISSTKDPWIEQVFPFGEGEYNVQIDFLDDGLKGMRDAGNWGYYTATLSLQRVEGK